MNEAIERNEVMSAIRQLSLAFEMLRPGTRETIPAHEFKVIATMLTTAGDLLASCGAGDIILQPIIGITSFLKSLEADPTYVETDSVAKSMLVENLSDVMQEVKKFAIEFYLEFRFKNTSTFAKVAEDLVSFGVRNNIKFVRSTNNV